MLTYWVRKGGIWQERKAIVVDNLEMVRKVMLNQDEVQVGAEEQEGVVKENKWK